MRTKQRPDTATVAYQRDLVEAAMTLLGEVDPASLPVRAHQGYQSPALRLWSAKLECEGLLKALEAAGG